MSPSKKQKLRSSQRVKVKTSVKDTSKAKRLKYHDALETHPVKRLATVTPTSKVKKTFKPHRPMTRAVSHLKSALKAAKLAANKKLRMVGRALPSKRDFTTLPKMTSKHKKESPVPKMETKPEKKKKLSLESSESKSSISKL